MRPARRLHALRQHPARDPPRHPGLCWRVTSLAAGQRRVYRVVSRARRIGVRARSTNTALSGRSRARARVLVLPTRVPPVTG